MPNGIQAPTRTAIVCLKLAPARTAHQTFRCASQCCERRPQKEQRHFSVTHDILKGVDGSLRGPAQNSDKLYQLLPSHYRTTAISCDGDLTAIDDIYGYQRNARLLEYIQSSVVQ